ncbi:unnamed protein product [Rangifer tarandus platyrhynchus]|uniref:Uncharacterized protein n=2 Tax=Rangifer tarandus platyrhynchus TaxID=3082113 RepID=A0ABN8YAY2_RANTA|nr:unnamed protein product [Rangifer tarandus platyrhynchus]CAI9698011.1 unnamed protein product [Rangifer tarandus platyrhynchus]
MGARAPRAGRPERGGLRGEGDGRNKDSDYSCGRRVAAARGRRAGQRLDSLAVRMAPRSPQPRKPSSSDRLLPPKEGSPRPPARPSRRLATDAVTPPASPGPQ